MVLSSLDMLRGIERHVTHQQLARELGVTRATITRYVTGIRTPTADIAARIPRAYERMQYQTMRAEGLSPQAASKYRGQVPETFDRWHGRLVETKTRFAEGHLASNLYKQGIDITQLSEDELADMYREAYEREGEYIDRSGRDISEYEQYL